MPKSWLLQHTNRFAVFPVYSVQNAVGTVESKESDPINLKSDYPEYWLMKWKSNQFSEGQLKPKSYVKASSWKTKIQP